MRTEFEPWVRFGGGRSLFRFGGCAVRWLWVVAAALTLFSGTEFEANGGTLDLHAAVVFCPPGMSAREQKAVLMLREEVENRTGIRWPETNRWPEAGIPVIVVGQKPDLAGAVGPYAADISATASPAGAEGFRLSVRKSQSSPAVLVVGNDARGVLFGIGRLLRELRLGSDRITLADDLEIATAPKYRLRGHQLGFRPKTNSYDAWDLTTWEQYFRDLAVFGCNAIELIPPRSDDDPDSPHFPRPPMEMMQGMSRFADAYGLDVWIWHPAMDSDYSVPATVENALKEWGDVLSKLPRVDAVFVPGGDPGHTPPKILLEFLARQSQNLRRYHPKAETM